VLPVWIGRARTWHRATRLQNGRRAALNENILRKRKKTVHSTAYRSLLNHGRTRKYTLIDERTAIEELGLEETLQMKRVSIMLKPWSADDTMGPDAASLCSNTEPTMLNISCPL
jgi:hypothetical protein